MNCGLCRSIAKCFLFASAATLQPLVVRAAEPINGYLNLSAAMLARTSAIESGMRYGFWAELGRVNAHVALDFRYMVGQGYFNYGSALRLFEFWSLDDKEELTLMAGVGALIEYALKDPAEALPRSYMEFGITPFVRTLWDPGIGMGVTGELGVVAIPARYYLVSNKAKEYSFRHRPYVSVGIAISVD